MEYAGHSFFFNRVMEGTFNMKCTMSGYKKKKNSMIKMTVPVFLSEQKAIFQPFSGKGGLFGFVVFVRVFFYWASPGQVLHNAF